MNTQIQSEVNKLSFDEKMKLWINYMVSRKILDVPEIFIITDKNRPHFGKIDYPILSATWGRKGSHKVIPFHDWIDPEKQIEEAYCCEGTYMRQTISLNYWYERFKDILNN